MLFTSGLRRAVCHAARQMLPVSASFLSVQASCQCKRIAASRKSATAPGSNADGSSMVKPTCGETIGHLEKLLSVPIADRLRVNVKELEGERTGIIAGNFVVPDK